MKNNKSGTSLVEISIAVLIFALCAIPLYYAVSYGSKEEIRMEKVALANKILESYRDEIKNLDYDLAKDFGSVSDNNGLPPETLKVVEQAKESKDFKVTVTSGPGPDPDVESTVFKAEVTWIAEGGGEPVTQKISFVKIKQ